MSKKLGRYNWVAAAIEQAGLSRAEFDEISRRYLAIHSETETLRDLKISDSEKAKRFAAGLQAAKEYLSVNPSVAVEVAPVRGSQDRREPKVVSCVPKRLWLRHSLKDLFLATTLMAMGIGGMAAVLRRQIPGDTILFVLGFWYACGGLIGASLFHLFHKTAIGAIVGFLVTWFLTLLMFWAGWLR